ncbi:unnamed protein product [Lactuca virosa]|uniref:Uncharacterized protein n=1 Tax=Lactuca virosa TaxID=75947 RepID=A0AAU9M5Z3_9ASTR|nr:unnamed protein product [Lactuca virosa]
MTSNSRLGWSDLADLVACRKGLKKQIPKENQNIIVDSPLWPSPFCPSLLAVSLPTCRRHSVCSFRSSSFSASSLLFHPLSSLLQVSLSSLGRHITYGILTSKHK